jgi:asparagine synthase (glutamine-hydrolysing)
VWAPRAWRRLRGLPRPARAAAAAALGAVPDGAWRAMLGATRPLLPRLSLPLDKLHKLVDVLPARSLEDVYLGLRTHWAQPEQVVLGAREPSLAPLRPAAWPRAGAATMQCLDAMTYLPDDILVKVDRASMAVGLEARVPFLDQRVAELAWSLREDQRIRDGQGKWLLRQVLDRYIPRELVERPKTGFSAPIGAWLRGELRDWAEALLDPRKLGEQGFFDRTVVRKRLDEHLRGRRDWGYQLWDVLMFQAWLER